MMDPESNSVVDVVAVEGKAGPEVVSKVNFSGTIVLGIACTGWCTHSSAGFLLLECIARFEDILAHEDFKYNGDGIGLESGAEWGCLQERMYFFKCMRSIDVGIHQYGMAREERKVQWVIVDGFELFEQVC
jgi:hypothetical protein